ncbi:hypothetical protein FQN57_005894 [Myotisia sp. PD_48]|nr:hypothetical protein FQN57_005894 [Myotisia sp. PD_48]
MAMEKKIPKLPVRQFVVLSICRFAEPVVFTSVFPYLPEMVRTLGIREKEDVAKWVGIISATFSICQCFTAIPWGNLSDRIGRKPVILMSLSITMCFSVLFGLSTSLTMAIFSRVCLGLGNGSVGIIRTIVAELVPERSLQPRAFSLMPLVWTIGSIFGPAFGGALANPVEKHPKLFGNSEFFKKYPFALPNFAAAVLFVIGITTGTLFLKETLESRKHDRDYGLLLGKMLTRKCCGRRAKAKKATHHHDDESAPLLADTNAAPQSPGPQQSKTATKDSPLKPLRWSDILTARSVMVLAAYAGLGSHALAYDSMLPVLLNLPVKDLKHDPNTKLPLKFTSGFGMDSQEIGILFTINGIIGMVVQFCLFPPIAKRFGVLRCFRVAGIVFPISYFLTPFIALFPTPTTRIVGVVAIMAVKLTCVVFAFPCCTILLTNSAPSMRVLGTLNGVATTVTGVGRAAGPAILGAVFSAGVKAGYIVIPWWMLAGLALLSAVPIFWLVETEGFMGADAEEDDDDDDGNDNGDDNCNENLQGHGERSCSETETETDTAPRKDHPISYGSINHSRKNSK